MSRKPVSSAYFILQIGFDCLEEAIKALNNQTKLLKKIFLKHPTFAAELIVSNVDGKVVERYNIREGKVGRPSYEFRRKKGTRKEMYTKYHIHIIIVALYAATVAQMFCDESNKRYLKSHPDSSLKEPFRYDKAKGDGLYSEEYFHNQFRNRRYVGDKNILAEFDRGSQVPVQNHLPQEHEFNFSDLNENDQNTLNGTVFVPKFNKRRNYSYTYTPGHHFNYSIPVRREVDYLNNSAGTAEAGTAFESTDPEISQNYNFPMSNFCPVDENGYLNNPRDFLTH